MKILHIKDTAPLTLDGKCDMQLIGPEDGSLVIDGGDGNGITLTNCRNIHLKHLRVSGSGRQRNGRGVGIGIYHCDGVTVEGCEAFGFNHCGILYREAKHLTLTHCFAYDNGACGISGATGAFPSEHVTITDCKAYNNAGDPNNITNHSGNGIVICHTHGALVAFCEAAGNGWAQRQRNGNGPVGIWACCDCKDVTFRYCIARDNRTQPGASDGGGFDFDGAVTDSLMEFCYSYANEGSGYLLCEYGSGMAWRNNTVRHCVSVADGHRTQNSGALLYYGPDWLKLEGGITERNLLSPAPGRACVHDAQMGCQSVGNIIRENVLVGPCAFPAPEQPYTERTGNTHLQDWELYMKLQSGYPRLTDPRVLPGLPVFALLSCGSCAETLVRGGTTALFGDMPASPAQTGGVIMHLDLTGRDTEGCERVGEACLCYDSIKPGMAARLAGHGASIRSAIPQTDPGKTYRITVSTRKSSPYTQAALFVTDDDGFRLEEPIRGGVTHYTQNELRFAGRADTLVKAGVQVAGGGYITVENIILSETEE
jgi:hypothetical protein